MVSHKTITWLRQNRPELKKRLHIEAIKRGLPLPQMIEFICWEWLRQQETREILEKFEEAQDVAEDKGNSGK